MLALVLSSAEFTIHRTACIGDSLIYLYWFLAVPTGALAALLVLLTVSGQSLSSSTPGWLSVSVGLTVLATLYWAHKLGTAGGRPGLAVLLVFASWLLFFSVMLANGLLQQQTWQ